MCLNDDPQASFPILGVSHADSSSHQSWHSVAPFVVQAFDDAGFSTSLAARPVLPGGKPFAVSVIKIAINQLAAIVAREAKPQAPEAFDTAVAQMKAHDLPCQA